jgi:hypothetical protein
MTDTDYPKVTRVLALENEIRVDYKVRENYTAQSVYTSEGVEHLDKTISVDEQAITEQVRNRLNQTDLLE